MKAKLIRYNPKAVINLGLIMCLLASTAATLLTVTISAETATADVSGWSKTVIDGDFGGTGRVYAVDVDSDGDMDVLGAAGTDDDIAWWENDGNQNFTKHVINGSFDQASWVYAIDIDGDSDVDVLGTAQIADDVAWWENDGNQNFTQHIIDGNFNGAKCVYAYDIDEDGDIDVLGAAFGTSDIIVGGEIAWYENDGSENFSKQIVDASYDGAHDVYAVDIDGDTDIDILGGAYLADNISWWENDGSENFTPHTIASFNGVQSVHADDVDGDGDTDILGAASYADQVVWWENDGSENFSPHIIESGIDSDSVYTADIDSDCDIDVLMASDDNGQVNWYENDGNENFSKRNIDNDFHGGHSVYAADVDSDGDMDVLGAASNINDIAWYENKGAFFSDDFEYDDSLENHGWTVESGNPHTVVDPEDAGNRAVYLLSVANTVYEGFYRSFCELPLQPGMEISTRFYDTGDSCGNCDVWIGARFDDNSNRILIGWYNNPSNFTYDYEISGSWSGHLYEPFGLRGVGWHTFTWRVEQNGGIDLLIDGYLIIDDLMGLTTLSTFYVNSGNDPSTYSFYVDDFSITATETASCPDTMVSAGYYHTLGLRSDGGVVALGRNDDGQCDVSGWSDITQVSAGQRHSVGLKSDGTVVALGWNDYGQCDVSSWSDITEVSAGGFHTVGLKSDGTVVAVGWNDEGQCNVSSWSDVTQVSAGGYHTVGLKSNGTVVAEGWNDEGQCNVSGWSNIQQVATGAFHTVALISDETVAAVGLNDFGQRDVSGWNGIQQISAEARHTVGLKADGTVMAVGWNDYGQCDVSGWGTIQQVDAGGRHTVGLKFDGTVVAVGYNTDGQCDVDDWDLCDTAPNTPSNTSPLNGATGISLTPTLTSSAFDDPDAGDTHYASQWQIATTPGDYSSPLFTTGYDLVNLTSIPITPGTLNLGIEYFWHVRYQDHHGAWSDWSTETSFATTCVDGVEFTADLNTVALWHFNEGTGMMVTDSSINGNNGARFGATWVDDGLGCSALDYNTGLYVEVPDNPSLDGMDELTIEAWIYLRSYPPTLAPFAPIVAKWGPSGIVDDSYKLYVFYTGQLAFDMCDGSDPAVTGSSLVYSTDLVPLQEWTLVKGTWKNPGEVHLYLNGIESEGIPFDPNVQDKYVIQDTPQPLWIGYEPTGGDNWFDGVIDEVRISNIARTPNNTPNQPSNTLPSNGAIGVSQTPTLTSSAFSDPDAGDVIAHSQWQITQVPGNYGAPIVYDYTDMAGLTSITVPSGQLSASTVYYWHVRHRDNNGEWSAYSDETSFTTASAPSPPTTVRTCFIATAAYGSPMDSHVDTLRDFRDQYLETNPVGEGMVSLYYRYSPPMADFIDEHPSLKPLVRAGLLPVVSMSTVAVNASPTMWGTIVGSLAILGAGVLAYLYRRRISGRKSAAI